MSKRLLDNIPNMSNAELIGLAKNRWLPEDIQHAISHLDYPRAKVYLAENEGLCPSVRDYMWSDDCNRGYSLKIAMITAGQYMQEPEKYWELYDRYSCNWHRSGWKMGMAFFGNSHWTHGSAGTPSALLNRIYDDRYDPKSGNKHTDHWKYGYGKYELERLARHPKVDIQLAIKLSQCGIESVQRHGFNKIVELSK